MNKKFLTTNEIAKYCLVTPRTANQWINEGKIKVQRTVGNHSRIDVEDFLNFLKKYNIPIPAELAGRKEQDDTKRILIVDDDRGMVDALQRVLLHEKYALETAFDGFEAGRKFAEFRPQLILLDIRMPGLNGFEVCSRIRSKAANSQVKIVFMSAAHMGEFEDYKSLGADEFLEKPFSNAVLKEKLNALLNKNQSGGTYEQA